MSHKKERDEKICLNCGTNTQGRFCHSCGQENIEPKESFSHLLRHFFEDLTHFDGKFFDTLVPLFTKPGFLSAEYMVGRRASYLNPIRMYLFISALFFLLLMTLFLKTHPSSNEKTEMAALGKGMTELGGKLQKKGAEISDTLSTGNTKIIYEGEFETMRAYDSAQAAMPEGKRDGAFVYAFNKKILTSTNHYKENKKDLKNILRAKFFHSLPYLFFASVPLVALLLGLLYFRRKQFYFVSHIIFVVHLYCFIFLLSLLGFVLQEFGNIGFIMALVLRVSTLIYLFMAMHRFYQQGIGKTLIKFVLFSVFAILIIVLLTFIVAGYTLMSVG